VLGGGGAGVGGTGGRGGLEGPEGGGGIGRHSSWLPRARRIRSTDLNNSHS
jgi:hypothetical protein